MRRVWEWELIDSWEQQFWSALKDTLRPDVVDLFRKKPPRYIVGDNLSWLNHLVLEATGEFADTKHQLAERITETFDCIRAYHGTRTSDPSLYYKNGLIPLDAPLFVERAKSIFLAPEFPELTEQHIDKAVSDVGTQTRQGLVYFAVNKSELLDDCAHYLLYGSEYLVALAAHLDGPRDYRQILKRNGTPSVFVCDVPLADIPFSLIAEYAGQALAIMFERILDPEFIHPQPGSGGGLWIATVLPPDHIVSHSHPTNLRDPFGGSSSF